MSSQTKYRNKALQNNYDKKYIKSLTNILNDLDNGGDPSCNLLLVISNDDIKIWYGLIFNLQITDNKGLVFDKGEYLLKLIAQDDYPRTPPKFQFLTPNGIFDPNTEPCLNIGHEHPENYNPTLGVPGFANAIVLAFKDYKILMGSGGRNIIKTNNDVIRDIALQSSKYNNENHSDIIKMFREHVDERNLKRLCSSLSFIE